LRAAEPDCAKARAAARLALAEIGAETWGGTLSIARPAAPGLGLGSSTAETLGAVRAVARAFGVRLAPEREAALCLAAEGAVDPLMWPDPVLFASRQGRVIERLPALPPMRVVGGAAGPPCPTDPADDDFPDLSEVFAQIAAALRAGDLAGLGRAATRSAEASQARRPNPAWAAVSALARRHGALGVAVSHSGPAIALILAPGSPADPAPELAALGLRPILDYRLGR
ncbi:MAG TPA: propanediol utilization protein, partial [Thermohalobaculum sp.]|nr:propanediol utilization protein [Thermohalobaculum sp.]